MTPSDTISEDQQIEQAIAVQESLRGQVDDAIIDATITTLKEKLTALDAQPEQQRKLATILFMDIADHTTLAPLGRLHLGLGVSDIYKPQLS